MSNDEHITSCLPHEPQAQLFIIIIMIVTIMLPLVSEGGR